MANATARVGAVPTPLRYLWNPQTCPAHILPWLGWALSVDNWNADWTEQQKRDTIAASVAVHRVKGTVGALNRALRPVGFAIQVDDQIPDLPYRFRLNVDLEGQALETEAPIDDAEAIALRVKNVRSYLIGIRATRTGTNQTVMGAATLGGDDVTIYPYQVTNLDSTNQPTFLLATHGYETVSVGGLN
jgi:phage tail P2-like protein